VKVAEVEVTGLAEAMALLQVGAKKVIPATMEALYAEAQIVLAQSRDEVPFRFGALSGSGMVHQPYSVGSKVGVEISYGGAAVDYAFIQHENEDFEHAPGRKAFYLRDPVDDASVRLAGNISARVKRILGQKSRLPEEND